MSFPETKYSASCACGRHYFENLGKAAASVDLEAINLAGDLLRSTIEPDGMIFSRGNGGSAAVSDQLVCDCAKGARTDCDNYGMVEDVHQSIRHILAQFLRQSRMPESLIRDRVF